MGFDTDQPQFTWKDAVAVELNTAIVQSFEVPYYLHVLLCDGQFQLSYIVKGF